MKTRIERAREFAVQAHAGQPYGDFPYTKHLQDVVNVLVRFQVFYEPVLVAAYLHDVLEDCGIHAAVISAEFGKDVADIVQAVTNEPGANRKERHIRTYPKIRKFGTHAVVLKLADRIANVEHSREHKTKHLKMYQREFPEFSTALYKSGECGAMWDHLRFVTLDERAAKPEVGNA